MEGFRDIVEHSLTLIRESEELLAPVGDLDEALEDTPKTTAKADRPDHR